MDESQNAEPNQKVLLGIVVAIAIGVTAHFVASMDVPAQYAVMPSQQTGSVAVAVVAVPVADEGMSALAGSVWEVLPGEWQSNADPRSKLVFNADGTVVSRYDGDSPVSKNGVWGVFTAEMAPEGAGEWMREGIVYMQVTIEGESRYFEVGWLGDALQLLSMENGSAARFTRI